MLFGQFPDSVHGGFLGELPFQGCHGNIPETAGVNPFEGGHVKVDVQRHSMKADSLPDSEANAAKLFVTDPDTAIPWISRSLDTEGFGNADHDFFEHEDQFRDAESLTIQISLCKLSPGSQRRLAYFKETSNR